MNSFTGTQTVGVSEIKSEAALTLFAEHLGRELDQVHDQISRIETALQRFKCQPQKASEASAPKPEPGDHLQRLDNITKNVNLVYERLSSVVARLEGLV